MSLSWRRFPGRFLITLFALALLLLILEHVNGRFWLNDLRVYYGAARAAMHDEPLYGVPHGLSSGVFKYAPIMAILYGIVAWLPYGIAATIQYVLIVSAFAGSVLLADKLIRKHVLDGREGSNAPILLCTLIVAVHLHRELHLGNINVLLMWLLLLALDRLMEARDVQAGFLIGLAALAKPHFLLLLPLLALRGRWKASSWALGPLVLGFLVPMLFFGPARSIELHREWIGEMVKHNASLIYTGGDAYNSVDTIYSFLHRSILHYFIPNANRTEVLVILVLVAIAFAGMILWNKGREASSTESKAHFLIEYILLIGLVPSITLTDTNHFLLATPLVLFILYHLLPHARWKWLAFSAIACFLAFGGNWGDVLGSFSDRLVHYGVLGIANIGLILIGLLILLNIGSNRSPLQPSMT